MVLDSSKVMKAAQVTTSGLRAVMAEDSEVMTALGALSNQLLALEVKHMAGPRAVPLV